MEHIGPSTIELHDQLLAISILRNADDYLCHSDDYWKESRYQDIEGSLRILRSLRVMIVRESNAIRKAKGE